MLSSHCTVLHREFMEVHYIFPDHKSRTIKAAKPVGHPFAARVNEPEPDGGLGSYNMLRRRRSTTHRHTTSDGIFGCAGVEAIGNSHVGEEELGDLFTEDGPCSERERDVPPAGKRKVCTRPQKLIETLSGTCTTWEIHCFRPPMQNACWLSVDSTDVWGRELRRPHSFLCAHPAHVWSL
jgi:hypothetical protein